MEKPESLRGQLRKLLTSDPAVQGTDFQKNLPERWKQVQPGQLTNPQLDNLIQKLKLEKEQLQKLKVSLDIKYQLLSPTQQKRLEKLRRDIDLAEFERSLRVFESQPWKAEKEKKKKFVAAFTIVGLRFIQVIDEARDERVDRLRINWPELPPVIVDGTDLLESDLDTAEAVVARSALANRLDLMNARGQVVDTWRQVRIFSNSLLGVFNVRYHMDSSTPLNQAKPLAFQGSQARHQLILNAELPLVRKGERNAYRASLIAFERARRALMANEDFIVDDVRVEIRNLRVLAKTYQIQQQAVHIAYPQQDSAEQAIFGPQDPARAGQPPTSGNSAALTNQLLRAQQNIVGAQNQMYAFWVNYLTARMQLYRDLGLMNISPRGEWLDEYATNATGRTNSGIRTDGPGVAPGGAEFLPPPQVVPRAEIGPPQ